ncbi:OmpC family outer membrane porin [Paraburkholderia piptadeniae]|uniref:OmpC family outer membrane porin n=1 Tax=Paraburkholderia piptadeniae TaxID=1701573 RepID=A0A1N7SE31_9BURK|nr:OmpC family outer membrane porin [Paraburkholderia piptadeniae]
MNRGKLNGVAGTTGALCAVVLLGNVMAPDAHAQNSVTLYGVVDAGVTYTSNAGGSNQYALTSGNMGANRWGLRGSEDLGGGLSTIFTLESGFTIANGKFGQNGTFFGRQAFVGLSGSWGAVTLGRQYASSSQFVGPLASGSSWAAPGMGYGTHPADLDNLNSTNRINNSIKFASANYNGLTFGGLYSLGGVAGDFSRNQIYSLAIGYTQGPVKLALGYLNVRNPNYSFWGNKANDSTTASNITSPVIAGYASANTQQVIAAGTSYAIGSATLGAVYSNVRFSGLGATPVAGLSSTAAAYRGSATFNNGELNAKYQVSPALLVGAAFDYMKGNGAGQGGVIYRQFNLGADYFLSKATDFYAVAVFQNASGVDSRGVRAVAAITGATPSTSSSQTVVTAGIRHLF